MSLNHDVSYLLYIDLLWCVLKCMIMTERNPSFTSPGLILPVSHVFVVKFSIDISLIVYEELLRVCPGDQTQHYCALDQCCLLLAFQRI